MQNEPTYTSHSVSQQNDFVTPSATTQDGFHVLDEPSPFHGDSRFGLKDASATSVAVGSETSADGVNAAKLDDRLRRLSGHDGIIALPGERISAYENAMTPTIPRQASGFTVIKRSGSPGDGPGLADCPNGTHLVLSYLSRSAYVLTYLKKS